MSEEGKQSPFAGTLYADSLFKQARFGEAASLYKTLLNSQPQPPCILSKWALHSFGTMTRRVRVLRSQPNALHIRNAAWHFSVKRG